MAPEAKAPPPQSTARLAVAGLLLVLAGVVGYFFVVFHAAAWVPWVRNDAGPNWILVALGLALSIVAIGRAPASRVVRVLLGVEVVLAGLFAVVLYVVPRVPAADGPELGAPAPDFALRDQRGNAVRLSDLRGSPVLLVFYRGHW